MKKILAIKIPLCYHYMAQKYAHRLNGALYHDFLWVGVHGDGGGGVTAYL